MLSPNVPMKTSISRHVSQCVPMKTSIYRFPHIFPWKPALVGGLEHLFFHILGIIIPTDEPIFFRGVGQPPTSTFLTDCPIFFPILLPGGYLGPLQRGHSLQRTTSQEEPGLQSRWFLLDTMMIWWGILYDGDAIDIFFCIIYIYTHCMYFLFVNVCVCIECIWMQTYGK